MGVKSRTNDDFWESIQFFFDQIQLEPFLAAFAITSALIVFLSEIENIGRLAHKPSCSCLYGRNSVLESRLF